MAELKYGAVPTRYRRTGDDSRTARLVAELEGAGQPVPARIFGNFLEHLGFAIYGGVWAQILSNPGFERDANLSRRASGLLKRAGHYLTDFFISGRNPHALPLRWTPGTGATGFGVAILDDHSADGIPLPWAPLGHIRAVSASVGRIGGAIRVRAAVPPAPDLDTVPLDDGPAGVRQGVFLPIERVTGYTGNLWLRAAPRRAPLGSAAAYGTAELGFRRRLGRALSPAGSRLAYQELLVGSNTWQKLPFRLDLAAAEVAEGEPVDFYLRWKPAAGDEPVDILVDRVQLLPADHVDGLDPDVLRLARDWHVPLLRWTGGNFVSHYHWRDGVGPADLRPVRPNLAWGGLDYNAFGCTEFTRFCRLIGAEPQITVNAGTGSPEEAAAWVEYCNGAADTPMGRLRAGEGHKTPYDVRLWEVGNESYGSWQGGYHGSEESARRYLAFGQAMRAVDPKIELIATGNTFDFVEPGPRLDFTTADRDWHAALLRAAGPAIENISLHSLPDNLRFLRTTLADDAAYYSLMSQPAAWERRFLPDLMAMAGERAGPEGQPPVRLAITEWGILGKSKRRPRVENFGGAVYAGLFLNFMLRNAEHVPIANATALLHGGCIRRAAAQVLVDPQYTVLREYSGLVGARPLACYLEGPGYNVTEPADLGARLAGVPYVDAVACQLAPRGEGLPQRLIVTAVNVHLSNEIRLSVAVAGQHLAGPVEFNTLAFGDYSAVSSLADPERFALQQWRVMASGGIASVLLRPSSVNWIQVELSPADQG